MTDPIYLDYNATTPLDPVVIEAMTPYITTHFGNPSSSHVYGQQTFHAVEQARARLAALINAQPYEIVFTGGGSEANNTVIKGVAELHRERGRHLTISTVEHPAVTEPCNWLATRGHVITQVPVDDAGRVIMRHLDDALTDQTVLVSVMLANNEVGTLQPIKEIARMAHEVGVLVHTDAAQAVGKIPVDVRDLGVDFLSVAGHKLYGPKGVGALYIREGLQLPPLIHGASHEGGRRAGTENVMGIVGLGAAASRASSVLGEEGPRLAALRDQLQTLLTDAIPQTRVNGHPAERLPNTLSISIKHVEANTLLERVGAVVAASAGAACHSGRVTVSSVLSAMGVPVDYAMGTLRLSLGRMTTADDVGRAAKIIVQETAALRSGA